MRTELHVPQASPFRSYLAYRSAIDGAMRQVAESGWYILGKEVSRFEQDFAAFTGRRNAIGVASGTDALSLSLRAMNLKERAGVVTVSHTAVATVAAIELAGHVPVLVDVAPETFNIDPNALEAVLANPPTPIGAVIPVHIYGRPAPMDEIGAVAGRYGVPILEDCSQAHGATYRGTQVGGFGVAGTYSFYPTKNLGALGDAGAIVTDDDKLAQRLRELREYGWRDRYVSAFAGMNTRLDELQAAILSAKLDGLNADNDRRCHIAAAYDAGLAAVDLVLPKSAPGLKHVYHQYVLRVVNRDAIRATLQSAGVDTAVHYPVPIHLQPAYRERVLVGPTGMAVTERLAREILSLPMFPQLTHEEVAHICDVMAEAGSAALKL